MPGTFGKWESRGKWIYSHFGPLFWTTLVLGVLALRGATWFHGNAPLAIGLMFFGLASLSGTRLVWKSKQVIRRPEESGI